MTSAGGPGDYTGDLYESRFRTLRRAGQVAVVLLGVLLVGLLVRQLFSDESDEGAGEVDPFLDFLNNDVPVVNADYVTMPVAEPVFIDVLENDFDPDGEELEIVDVSQSTGGVFEIVGSRLRFTPLVTGDDGRTVYDVEDAEGGRSSGVVVVSVEDSSLESEIVRLDTAVLGLRPIDLDVLSNDFAPNGQELSLVGVEQVVGGSIEILEDDVVRFTPDLDWEPESSGSADAGFSYRVSTTDGRVEVGRAVLSRGPEWRQVTPLPADDFAAALADLGPPLDVDVDGSTMAVLTPAGILLSDAGGSGIRTLRFDSAEFSDAFVAEVAANGTVDAGFVESFSRGIEGSGRISVALGAARQQPLVIVQRVDQGDAAIVVFSESEVGTVTAAEVIPALVAPDGDLSGVDVEQPALLDLDTVGAPIWISPDGEVLRTDPTSGRAVPFGGIGSAVDVEAGSAEVAVLTTRSVVFLDLTGELVNAVEFPLPDGSTPAGETQLSWLDDGDLLMTDRAARRVWRMSSDGSVETFAGSSDEGEFAPGSVLEVPLGPIVGAAGDLATASWTVVSESGELYRIR